MKKLLLLMLLCVSLLLLLPSVVMADSYYISAYQWGNSVYLNANINTNKDVLRDILLVYEINRQSYYSETVAIKNFGSWAKVFNIKHGKARFKIIDYKYNITNYSNWVSF